MSPFSSIHYMPWWEVLSLCKQKNIWSMESMPLNFHSIRYKCEEDKHVYITLYIYIYIYVYLYICSNNYTSGSATSQYGDDEVRERLGEAYARQNLVFHLLYLVALAFRTRSVYLSRWRDPYVDTILGWCGWPLQRGRGPVGAVTISDSQVCQIPRYSSPLKLIEVLMSSLRKRQTFHGRNVR